MLVGTYAFLSEVDKSLEMAELIRAGEAGYARDYRAGAAFGNFSDSRRLDAFTLGLLEVLADRLGHRDESLRLLTYLHKLLALGPGEAVRREFRAMHSLYDADLLTRYVAGGRYHALKLLSGKPPVVGQFSQLLAEELAGN